MMPRQIGKNLTMQIFQSRFARRVLFTRRCFGPIDSFETGALRDSISRLLKQAQDIVLNLSGLQYLDSSESRTRGVYFQSSNKVGK